MIRLLPIQAEVNGKKQIIDFGNQLNDSFTRRVKASVIYASLCIEDRMRSANKDKAEYWFDFSELPELSYVVEPQVQPTWLELAGKYGYTLQNPVSSTDFYFNSMLIGEHTKKIYF